MKILSMKPGHDGHIAFVKDDSLAFSIEAEKDSWRRYALLTPSTFLRGLQYLDELPDVVAVSGWIKTYQSGLPPEEAGYFGVSGQGIITRRHRMLGEEVHFFSSSHERSHILCAYGMSPFAQGEPCFALVWEGNIGAFYFVDEQVGVHKLGDVMQEPGLRYSFGYALADPSSNGDFRHEDAGKMMALAAFGEKRPPTAEETRIIDEILALDNFMLAPPKHKFSSTHVFNAGVQSEAFTSFARQLSDAIFARFFRFAESVVERPGETPLLIVGGCGLNCDWNTRWRESGLFSDVFVPPCANDSGSAIGTAVDALHHYTGRAKIGWTPYAGEEFVEDMEPSNFSERPLDYGELASRLDAGQVIAWVQGRYEIGPRALGNRSLLAAPFAPEMHRRLNAIKEREPFRPIAPICMEEELDRLFGDPRPSPYMLHFQQVLSKDLKAVTHVDGTARLQSVSRGQNEPVWELLRAFKERTGYGVLCNTSLNFKGRGFINRMSDLVRYVEDESLDGFVVGQRYFCPSS